MTSKSSSGFPLAGFPSVTQSLLPCLVLVFVYVLSVAIYNVYFHPLRSYPGPKLWAAFRLPFVYDLLKGRLPFTVKKFHDQYGTIVRVAPNELAYSDASAWKDIYVGRPGKPENPRDLTSFPAPHKGQATDFFRGDEAVHSRARRLLSYGFSSKALEDQQPLIIHYVDLLVQRLRENAGPPQNMVAWYNWATFDIIGDLTFGESFHGLQDQRYHPWVETVTEGLEAGVFIAAANLYGLGFAFDWVVPKAMLDKFDQLWTYTKEKVGSRLERETDRPDLMSFIMRNDKEGKQMTRAEIEANAGIIVNAGSETTASVLSGVTFYLCMNPLVLEKLTREIRSTFNSDQDINLHSVNNLPYLTAVLTESLRKYPPAPGSLPRRIVHGDTVVGKYVPPGTITGIFQWATFHSAANFHDPDTFAPERWLPDAPAKYSRDKEGVLQSFGGGPRGCIGKSLANFEMRAILAKLLWNFDLSIEEECKTWIQHRAHLVWAKPPLMIRFKPVQRGE